MIQFSLLLLLLLALPEANLASVIRYVVGCNQLTCTGHWDAWLLMPVEIYRFVLLVALGCGYIMGSLLILVTDRVGPC